MPFLFDGGTLATGWVGECDVCSRCTADRHHLPADIRRIGGSMTRLRGHLRCCFCSGSGEAFAAHWVTQLTADELRTVAEQRQAMERHYLRQRLLRWQHQQRQDRQMMRSRSRDADRAPGSGQPAREQVLPGEGGQQPRAHGVPVGAVGSESMLRAEVCELRARVVRLEERLAAIESPASPTF